MGSGNSQNGGLLVKLEDGVVLTDCACGTGIYLIKQMMAEKITSSIAWFMNVDKNEEYIYYSNEANDFCLCCLDLKNRTEKILIEEPTYLVRLLGNEIYYINYKNKNLYKCSIYGQKVKRVIQDEVINFVLTREKIWYATTNEIKSCDLDGHGNKRIIDKSVSQLSIHEDGFLLNDSKKDYSLEIWDFENKECINRIEAYTTNINTYNEYVFYINRADKSCIYRYDTIGQKAIRFIGQRADYLHIIDEKLYFYDQDCSNWFGVNVMGGKPECLFEGGEVDE